MMNSVYVILTCSLCLQTLANANYVRIPKRALLQNQDNLKGYFRKVPYFRTIPGSIPILPEAHILPEPQRQAEALSVTPIGFINNAQNFADILPSNIIFNRLEAQTPSAITTSANRPEQLLPQKLTANYLPYNTALGIQDNSGNLPQNQLKVKQIQPRAEFSEPIVKNNLPEIRTLPIFTLLPTLTSLPKVNLLPQTEADKPKLTIEDSLQSATENEGSQQNVINLNITQEVKYEIVSQKLFKSEILHKLQTAETKSNFMSTEIEEKLQTNDRVTTTDPLKNGDFVRYFRSLQEKAEGYILRPQSSVNSPQKVVTNTI